MFSAIQQAGVSCIEYSFEPRWQAESPQAVLRLLIDAKPYWAGRTWPSKDGQTLPAAKVMVGRW